MLSKLHIRTLIVILNWLYSSKTLLTFVDLPLLSTTTGRNRLWSKLVRDRWQSAIAYIDLAFIVN